MSTTNATNTGKITAATIARTVCLIITLANTVLTVLGKNPLPFAEDDVYNYISTAATVIVTIIAWWKNNSFTAAAITADKVMKGIKNDES